MSPFELQRWRRALFLFSGIFIVAVVTQFGIGWYERRVVARSQVIQWADEIRQYLAYSERWDLTQYRQADIKALSYCVLDNNGLSIEIERLSPAMELRVDLNEQPPGLRTVTVPETGETLRMLVKQVVGGTIILGVPLSEHTTDIDNTLEENAKRFGSSLETALRLDPSDTDSSLQYAIVDRIQRVRFAIGSIPLRIVSHKNFPSNEVTEVYDDEGHHSYGVFSTAFRDGSGRVVGTIFTFEELPLQPWFILRTWIVNCLSSAILAFVGTLIGIPYIGERFDPRRLLHNSLHKGESATVEFKQHLRWDHWQDSPRGIAEGIAIKTVAAFLNNREGGTLFIGIADDKGIVGLERDYESLMKGGEPHADRDKDRDRFQLHLRNLLAARIGLKVSNRYVQTAIVDVDGKDVCVVHASPAAAPVYLPDGKAKGFCVRDGASTKPLDVEEVVAYIEQRWPKALWRRVWNSLHSI